MSTSASLHVVAVLAATLVIVYRILQMYPYSNLGERLITVIHITKNSKIFTFSENTHSFGTYSFTNVLRR